MIRPLCALAYCAITFSLSLPALAQEQPPAIFQDLGFESAQQAAKDKGGLLILDAMTSWCGPCKQMDRTTWIDPRLVDWMEGNAVAIQLDMDEHEALKQRLEIRAFPTIVMFKDGMEFDRVVGLRSADEMLAWLGAGLEGRRAKDALLDRLTELRADPAAESTWGERAKLVADLMWVGEYEEALEEHLWLWRSLPSTNDEHGSRRSHYRWGRQRHSMRELAGKLPAARLAFQGLRDELSDAVLANKADANHLRDWIELNFAIDEERTTVRWANGLSESKQGVARLRSLDARLFDLLIANDAWRTAGLGLADPVKRTRAQRDSLGAYDKGPRSGGGAGVMPAIPMGGMKPARKAKGDGAKVQEASLKEQEATSATSPATGDKKKVTSMPMIPMGSMRPAKNTDDSKDVAVEVRRLLTEQFRTQASQRYGALLAAGRETEAAEIAEVVITELDDSRARAALLSTALRSGAFEKARKTHQAWLEWIAR